MGRPGWTTGLWLLVALLVCAFAGSAQAATITVTTTADTLAADGQCSLREAVIAANADTTGPDGDCTAGNGADTINLAGGAPYKLTIAPTGTDDATTGDLNLTQPVTITGATAASTTLDGGGLDRVFSVQAPSVQIADVTITGGNAGSQDGGGLAIGIGDSLSLTRSIVTANTAYSGGGVSSLATQVTITDSTISHNDGGSGGGGIFNNGTTLTIERTQITNNTALRAGGIFENHGSLTISNSSVSDNGDATTAQGGGLEIDGGPTTLTNVQVTGNSGGGIFNDVRSSQTTKLTRTVVSGNTGGQGAGIASIGALDLTDSWVHDNSAGSGDGGGVWFQPRNSDEQLQIEGSTIGPSNRAGRGDGVMLAGTGVASSSTISRSTIAGNGDDLHFGNGGGVFVGFKATATLNDDTLAENKASNSTGGGNLYAADGSTVSWQNTLVARAFGGGNCDHGTAATLTTHGGNEEYGDPDALCGFSTAAGDSASPTDLDTTQLGELKDNGGPTETMALLAGAPPIDTGSGCQPADQRGVPRPQGAACDSGAYELDTTPPTASITSGPSGNVSANVVSFTFTANEPASFECQLDAGGLAPCTSPFTTGVLSNGSHAFSVRATDTAGNVGSAATRNFTVVPAGSGSPGGPGSPGGSTGPTGTGGGLTAPTISSASQTARSWREGSHLPRAAQAHVPVGTTFSFTLNEPAQVVFTFTRPVTGRRVHGRCGRTTKANRAKPRCRYPATFGTLRVQAHSGRNTLHFEGRLSRRQRLTLGSYTLLITATAQGRSSAPAVLRFRIVRG